MKNIAVACYTLRDEVRTVLQHVKVDYPIIWIDSGLHNFPEKLNKGLQDQINKIDNVDNILLIFGTCGNSLAGLTSPKAKLIFPRVDDCISLFLGGNARRRTLDREETSYYLTKGYLENENNIWSEYNYCLNKYGPEKAKRIYDQMLRHYKRLLVIDNGAYDPEEILEETQRIAQVLELKHEVTEGSLRILYKAFNGEWDEEFAIIEPGKPISSSDLGLL